MAYACGVFFVLVCAAFLCPGWQWVWLFPLLVLAALAVLEVVLRVLLYISYGPAYRYSFLTYFLVDDPHYGTGFPTSADSTKLDLLLFDSFVFPPNTPRIHDAQENRNKRVVFTTNSLGFRGKEFMPRKSAKLRIFCQGGSSTACDCCDDNEAWPAQLERSLRARGYDVEVINAGVQGWDAYQNFLRFKREIVTYDADIVLMHHGWNEEFKFSSQALGTKWKPHTLRNVREEHSLYCPPNRFLSSTLFVSLYLFIKEFRKKYLFTKRMSFSNPKRWAMLTRPEYLLAWFDTLVSMAHEAKKHDVLLYCVEYPALVSMQDTPTDRAVYIRGSRLSSLFADYQAVAKQRVSDFLRTTSTIVPVLDAQARLARYTGASRTALLYDEMHTTPQGSVVLAESLAACLAEDEAFQKRYSAKERASNVSLVGEVVDNARAEVQRGSPYLERFVANTIASLSGKGTQSDIPKERYTTF